MKIFILLALCVAINLIAGCACGENEWSENYDRIYIKSTDSTYKISQLYFVEMNHYHHGNSRFPVNCFNLPIYQKQLTTFISDTSGEIDTLIISINYESKAVENTCGNLELEYRFTGYHITHHSFVNAYIKFKEKNSKYSDSIIITP